MLFVTDQKAWVNVSDIVMFHSIGENLTRIHVRRPEMYADLNIPARQVADALTQVAELS